MSRSNHPHVVFSESDSVYREPEKFMPKILLEGASSYHIFSGVGVLALVQDHNGGNRTVYYENRKSLENWVSRNARRKILSIQDCFYAYVVKQNSNDPFQEGELRC
jgi:hypothetical protein